jgi:xanthine/uracil permease
VAEQPNEDHAAEVPMVVPPTRLTTRRRILWGSVFGFVALFWGTSAVIPGSIPQRVFCGVLCLAFAHSAWRAVVRAELDANDDE